MSAYAAAYAPPPGGYAGGFGGTYGGGGGKGTAATAAASTASAAPGSAPRSYAPPGATGSAPPRPAGGFTYAGVGGAGLGAGWPSAEQLVAAVPVRPYDFAAQPRRVAVGERGGVEERCGKVPKPYLMGEDAEFFLLKSVLTDNEVAEVVAAGSKILSDLVGTGRAREPDPSDGRPRFAAEIAHGGAYSKELEHVLKPLVEGALLPYVRDRYQCPGAALASALLRRYVPEERRFVPPHFEHGAFAVCAVGLQDPAGYTGGMYVQGSGRAFLDRKFLPLGRGDVCVHRHDLHHGVEVQDGSRFELLLVFKDSPQAAVEGTSPWYRQAAEGGDASAQYGWALSLLAQKDYAAAKAWLEKACAQDYPEALYTHADWAWEPPAGSGFQADTARSLQLFRRAAELGHGRSQSRLGGMLAGGIKGRVQQDSWEGKRLLRLAFEQDEPDAGFHLGQTLLQEGDRDGATKLLAACAKGHPRACFQVAEMYREGQYQFSKDLPRSLQYTKWAAHQGDPQALSNLGHLLINGHGVVRDDAKAVRLFRHAAKLGAAEGMLNYGLALLRGNGGAKVDYAEALEWAKKAAAEGNTLAHQQLPMFFNAAKNPNPPARSLPTSREELQCLAGKDLRELLRSEGIDFSDCVEKTDLVARAAMHLPGVAEPWDPAPEHTLLLEPPRRTRAELLKQREQQQQQQQQQQPQPTAEPAPGANESGEQGSSRAAVEVGSTASSSWGREGTSSQAPHTSGERAAPEAGLGFSEAGSSQAQKPFSAPPSAPAAVPSRTPIASAPAAVPQPKAAEFESVD